MKLPDLDTETIDRIIEMAWEDRTPFDVIEKQFGLLEKQVIRILNSCPNSLICILSSQLQQFSFL